MRFLCFSTTTVEQQTLIKFPGVVTVVHKLHYEFHGWLGDELLESTPCFIVSERMAREIENARLIGASFDQVEVTTSAQFQELYPNRPLPEFVWLRVNGKAGQDDFGIAPDARLVVSEKALGVLQNLPSLGLGVRCMTTKPLLVLALHLSSPRLAWAFGFMDAFGYWASLTNCYAL